MLIESYVKSANQMQLIFRLTGNEKVEKMDFVSER